MRSGIQGSKNCLSLREVRTMSEKRVVSVLERGKNAALERAQETLIDQVINILLSMKGSGKVSDKAWLRLIQVAEKLDRNGSYAPAIRAVRDAFETNHPYIQFLDIVSQKSPACRRKLIRNFFINAAFKGTGKRKAFSKKHGIPRPFFFVISPSMRCNLHCIGCYAGKYDKGDKLSFETIDRIFSDAKEMGIYFITVSGGEPFFRRDLLDLFAKHDDIYFQVFTNGTLIDENLAGKLSELGNVAPVISCEGFEAETDHRRGKGTFQKVSLAMDNLREAGVIFGFSTVPAAYNYDTLYREEYYRFLVEKGALFGWFFQYIPIGFNPQTDLMLTPEQRVTIHDRVREMRNKYPIFIADFWNDGPYVEGCLAAGRNDGGYFHINSNGDVEPCVFAHFAADNILNIYNRGGHLWDALNSPFFREIRAGQPWNRLHQMPCMIIDNPRCLRRVVKKTHPHPTHEGAESIVENPAIVRHLNHYSRRLEEILSERERRQFRETKKVSIGQA